MIYGKADQGDDIISYMNEIYNIWKVVGLTSGLGQSKVSLSSRRNTRFSHLKWSSKIVKYI